VESQRHKAGVAVGTAHQADAAMGRRSKGASAPRGALGKRPSKCRFSGNGSQTETGGQRRQMDAHGSSCFYLHLVGGPARGLPSMNKRYRPRPEQRRATRPRQTTAGEWQRRAGVPSFGRRPTFFEKGAGQSRGLAAFAGPLARCTGRRQTRARAPSLARIANSCVGHGALT
jgi:hypothetical protein